MSINKDKHCQRRCKFILVRKTELFSMFNVQRSKRWVGFQGVFSLTLLRPHVKLTRKQRMQVEF